MMPPWPDHRREIPMELKTTLQKTKLYKKYNTWHWRERITHPGKLYPDQTFYVIRRHSSRAGLFSFYVTNLGSIVEARKKSYIPVIDMQNSINPMLTPERLGHENAWTDYFQQPAGFDLNDLEDAENVILGSIDPPVYYPDDDLLLKKQESEIAFWRNQAHQNITLRDDIQKTIDEQYHTFSRNGRLLGVLCRGTDYLLLHPKNHPVQPDPDLVIEDCRKALNKYNCSGIYLATEDRDIYGKFQEAFGDLIVSYQKHHFTTASGENLNDVANRQIDPRIRNTEYLISIGILARCSFLIAGATSGSLGAVLMSDGFEAMKIYDLGRY